uniref:Uncharacterized protein n=1 Tax=Arundo donax TaxID=35708 RepID=A0A0A9G770_ARUDO
MFKPLHFILQNPNPAWIWELGLCQTEPHY